MESIAGAVRKGIGLIDASISRYNAHVKDFKSLNIAILLVVAWATYGYAQAPVLQSKVTYLSDLTPAGNPINGYGPYEKDKSNGENAAGDGDPLQMGRVPYAKGLGVHAPSDLTFALNKEYVTFSAAVGIDDEILKNGCAPGFPGSVVFQVLVDDEKVYDSAKVTVQSSALDVIVDVTGKTTLRLVVGGAGDDLVCDHADWADAKLTGPAQSVIASTPLPPESPNVRALHNGKFSGRAFLSQGTGSKSPLFAAHLPLLARRGGRRPGS